MSSFLVTDVHISAIVQEMALRGVITVNARREVAVLMKHENLRALNARYGDDLPTVEEVDEDFDLSSVEAPLVPEAIILLIAGWKYQCLEGQVPYGDAIYVAVEKLYDILLAATGLRDHYSLPERWRLAIASWDEVIAA